MTTFPRPVDPAAQPPTVWAIDAWLQWGRGIVSAVNAFLRGSVPWVADLTLTANAASTTLTDARLTYFSAVVFMPMTANAAAEIGAGTLYVLQANMKTGVWVITHANNAQTDRTFRLAFIG